MWIKQQGRRYFDSKILKDLDHLIEVMLESEDERTDNDNLETTENCLDAFRIASNETLLVSKLRNYI